MSTPDLPPHVMEKLIRVFAAYPELTQVTLFGSRATGKASTRSDIDLATRGIVDDGRLGRLALDLADLDIPQICDLKACEHVAHAPLKRHIDRHFGTAIYAKQGNGGKKNDDGTSL